MVFQSILGKVLLALVALAGPADGRLFDVPRLVAEARTTSARYVQAPDVAGRWRGTTGQGRRVTLDIAVEASAVAGTLTLDEQSSPITDGKIDKGAISFNATFGGRTAAFAGRVAWDTLILTMEGAQNPVTLGRVK